MKTNKSVYLIIAGLIGCGICCLPLLLPIAAGIAGISVFSFSSDEIICGAIFLFLALILVGIYLTKRKKNVCDLPIPKNVGMSPGNKL